MKAVSILLAVALLAIPQEVRTWPVYLQTGFESMLEPCDCTVLGGGEIILSMAGPFVDPVITCFDGDGQLVWQRSILEKGGSSRSFESGGYLQPVADGFVAAFHSEPRATGVNTDVAVIRMDALGDTLWTYVLGLEDSLNWMCTDIIQCTDGGFMITGCPGTMLPGGYAFKLSHGGLLEWITPTDVIDAYLSAAVELQQGGFLGLLQHYYGNDGLLLIDSDGNIQQTIEIGHDDRMGDGGIHQTPESVWISSVPFENRFEMIRLTGDMHPDSVFSSIFPDDVVIRHVDMTEGGIVIAAGSCGDDGFLALSKPDGEILWQETLDGNGETVLQGACMYGHGVLTWGTCRTDEGEWLAFMDLRDISGFFPACD